jgi:glycosyltransferase involved in cell wall biosynthesis
VSGRIRLGRSRNKSLNVLTILYVTSGLGLGGAETMLLRITSNLHRRGHSQHVASLTGRGALASALEACGVPVTDLAARSTFGAIAATLRLRRLINRIAPDVVQGWMYHGNLAATFAHLTAPQLSARRLYWNLRASNMDGRRYGGVVAWNAWLSRFPDTIVANSKAGADFHIAQGFCGRRIEIVPNGIDTEKFRPDTATRAALRAAYGIGVDEVVVIHVARVDPMKDHANFLAAIKSLPHIKAILVGAGTKELQLPSNVLALGIRSDVERLYPAADIIVSSSAFGEGFSNAIAEGMSAGLVPVATDVGDARLIIGGTGCIVRPKDAAVLAAALAGIAAQAPDARQQLGLAARDRILKHFTLARAVETFDRLYSRS